MPQENILNSHSIILTPNSSISQPLPLPFRWMLLKNTTIRRANEEKKSERQACWLPHPIAFLRRSHRGRRDAERRQNASFARPPGRGAAFPKETYPNTSRLAPAELPGGGDEGGASAAAPTHVLQVPCEALGRKRSPWGFGKHIQGATEAHALECALHCITKRINAPANKS